MAVKHNPSAVIDTNLFISAIITRGVPFKLLKAWQRDKFVLVASKDLFGELEEVLKRDIIFEKYKPDEAEIQQVLDAVKLNAKFTTSLHIHDLPLHSRDPKDDRLLACALGGNADYLVTGDEDLLVLKNSNVLGGLKITTAKEFLGLLDSLLTS